MTVTPRIKRPEIFLRLTVKAIVEQGQFETLWMNPIEPFIRSAEFVASQYPAIRSRIYKIAMSNFVYRCPNTGLHTHAWVGGTDDSDQTYEAVTCTACQQVHLINTKTGKLIGDDED
jgi:hypothetical protein